LDVPLDGKRKDLSHRRTVDRHQMNARKFNLKQERGDPSQRLYGRSLKGTVVAEGVETMAQG
jgi:hypothetical protein